MYDRDVIDRIIKRITINDITGCWEVSGWDDGKGYRNISVKGATHKVHRVMFQWFWRRKLRKGVQIDHICNNRSCCNPLHLQAVMNKKNARLREKRKRKSLREQQVERIEEMCAVPTEGEIDTSNLDFWRN